MGGRRRKYSACAFGVDGAFGALQMLDSHLAMRHRARLLANAAAPRAVGAALLCELVRCEL